jgi:hypothetical protein
MSAISPDPAATPGSDPEGTRRRDRLGAAAFGRAGPGLAPPGAGESYPGEPVGDELARQEEEFAAYLAATAGEGPPDEHTEMWLDPGAGPPLNAGFRLSEAPQPPSADTRAGGTGTGELPPPVAPERGAEVMDHDGSGPGGPGFASGSWLDQLGPGPALAAALDEAWHAGLGQLGDDELAGVMLAFRRCESRAAAGLLAATAELAARRAATREPRIGEHTDSEVGILLTLTRRAAENLLGFATSLARLPATSAALAAGLIDRDKADLIAYETALLDDVLAAAVEQLVIEDAPRLTLPGLRARLRRAVLAADPGAARRRAAQAARDARVELYDERSGATAALSGRDLPVRGALAADQRIDAAARELKAAGVDATLPQLRAAVFLGLLTGADPRTFLPASPDDQATTDPGPASPNGQTTASRGPDASSPLSRGPAGGPSAADTTGSPGAAGGAWLGPGPVTLRGSVNLTVPLASWLGQGFSPGDIAGFGPVTAETGQDVADWIAEKPGSRWCVTLTDKTGRAVGHGCARRPPPARGDPAGLAAWLARLKVEPIEAGTCSHAREVPGYRIPARLHHIVKVRQRTCVNPICRRPAIKCDDDHTVPYDQGGRTCECGLGPACRGCHRTKQTPGWRLEQPSPGVFQWHLPNGRTVTTTPDPYPV